MKLFVNISLLLIQFQSLLRKLLTVVALRHIILSFERNMFKAQVQDLLGRQSLCAATYIFSNIFFKSPVICRWWSTVTKNVCVWKHFCPNNENCRLRLWYKCIGQVYRPENQQSTKIFWQLNNTQQGYFSHKRVDIRHFYEALNQEMTTRIEFYEVAQPRRGCWFEQNKWAVFLTIKSKCWH